MGPVYCEDSRADCLKAVLCFSKIGKSSGNYEVGYWKVGPSFSS